MGEAVQKQVALLLTALAAFCAALICLFTGVSAPLDRAFTDYSTRLSSRSIQSDVVIVEIDARSLHDLGAWPWPRRRHAALVQTLQQLGAKRIFLDIDFSAPSNAVDDEMLSQALGRVPGLVVLPQFWQPLTVDSKPLLLSEPLPELSRYAQLGSVNLQPDSDGLVRDVPDLNAVYPTSAPPVWRAITDAGPGAALALDYRLRPDSFAKFSYSELLEHRSAPDLRGKIVMVGATAIELGDIVTVPVYRSLPGVLVQATALETGRRAPLRSASMGAVILLLALGAFACTYLLGSGSWRTLPWVTAAWVVATLAVMHGLYAYANIVPIPAPFLALPLCSFAGVTLYMLYAETWRSWRAGHRLRQQDALHREMVNRSADALFTVDPTGVIRTANEATARLLRRDLGTLIGLPVSEVLPELASTLAAVSLQQELPQRVLQIASSDGSSTAVEVSARHLDWEDSAVIAVGLHDVSAQQQREEELRYRATHDSLTGLPNRLKLEEMLAHELTRATLERPLQVLMIDLDGFKEVNDTLGHDIGDALLVELGRRLSGLMSSCTCIARLGGDEFAILLSDELPRDLAAFCTHVRSTISAPIVAKGVPLALGASVGISVAPLHATEPAQLLQCADLALYAAKRAHSDVETFDVSMDIRSPRRLQMLTLLRSAIQRDELSLVFQPKVSLQASARPEVEVLCRWTSPELGMVSPAEFIPLAEASDLIRPLTEWTMARALGYCRSWHAQGIPLKVAVNLSARHLQDEQLPQWLGSLLAQSGVAAEYLELEITEGAIMRDPDRALRILQRIRMLGIALSIDDYGTGYSSLSYLHKLSVDRLKIDKSFVSSLTTGERDQLIVKSTIDLAHALRLEVIAEGIETSQQESILRRLGCDYAQGYLYSRPLKAEGVAAWFLSQHASQTAALAVNA